MEAASSAADATPLPPHDEVRVNVHYAKTNLSKLLERVEQGEDIVICRNGVPVVRLAAWTEPVRPRTGRGSAKGLPWMTGLTDLAMEPTDPELVDIMENGPIEPEDSHE